MYCTQRTQNYKRHRFIICDDENSTHEVPHFWACSLQEQILLPLFADSKCVFSDRSGAFKRGSLPKRRRSSSRRSESLQHSYPSHPINWECAFRRWLDTLIIIWEYDWIPRDVLESEKVRPLGCVEVFLEYPIPTMIPRLRDYPWMQKTFAIFMGRFVE